MAKVETCRVTDGTNFVVINACDKDAWKEKGYAVEGEAPPKKKRGRKPKTEAPVEEVEQGE